MNIFEDDFINAIHFAIVDAIKNDEKALWYFNKHKDSKSILLKLDISVAGQLALDDLKGDN